ncbi:MAG: glycerol-3-phosphate 1-O-acyltransferase PlsY [Candidatus Methylacidiphilales bacterium]
MGRLRGRDLRNEGSGNIGATNAFRVLGPRWGMVVFALDFLKGWAPIWWLDGSASFHIAWGEVGSVDAGLLVCGLFVVLGHNYTPFLGFRGGKGIASSAGLLLALLPTAFLITALVWGLVFAVVRIVSVASLSAAVVLPFAAWATVPDRPLLIGLCSLLAVISFWRHRSNLVRLWNGTEPSFGKRKDATIEKEVS